MSRITLRAKGIDYGVELLGSNRVAAPGLPSPLTVRQGGSGLALVESGDTVVRAFVAGAGSARWVFIDGQVWHFEAVRPAAGRRAKKRSQDEGLVSPMPATVLKINVSVGDVVEEGEVLVVLEAMKMELPVRSPKAGTVRSIGCRVGEIVQPDVVLVLIE